MSWLLLFTLFCSLLKQSSGSSSQCSIQIEGDACTCRDVKEFYKNNACCGDVSRPIESSTTNTETVGGTLYVHNLAHSTWSQQIDLARASLESDHPDCKPAKTPHMVKPQPISSPSYVAVTYTSDRHVHILDASTKKILICFAVPNAIQGVALHDGIWHLEDSTWYFVAVDMTGNIHDAGGGGGLHLFRLDLQAHTADYISSWSASLELSLPITSTKPISMGTNTLSGNGAKYFVTDAFYGGGYFVQVNGHSGTIALVQHITNTTLVQQGCAQAGSKLFGLWTYAHPKLPNVLIAQYGQQISGYSCLLLLDVMQPSLEGVVPLSPNGIDAHGIGHCEDAHGNSFLLVSHRVSATMDIVDYTSRTLVVQDIDLNAALNGAFPPVDGECGLLQESLPVDTKRFQPDVFSVQGRRLYFTSRGRRPLSAVLPVNWLPYASPGLYTFDISEDCQSIHSASFSLPVYNNRTLSGSADPHGGDLVGSSEFWLIDQSPTSVRVQRDTSVWHLSTSQVEFLRDQPENFLFLSRDDLPQELPCLLQPPSAPPFIVLPPPPPPTGGGGMGR